MIFPYKIELERHRLGLVTYTIIFFNCFIYVLFSQLSHTQQEFAGYLLGFTPDCFSFKQAITSTFLHIGIVHLAGNMFFLWIYGRYVEDRLSSLLFIVLYFSSGIAAAATQMISGPAFMRDIPCIGASGAISGILGAFFIFFYTARVRSIYFSFILRVGRLITFPAYIIIGSWFILQLFYAFTPDISWYSNIAFWAHLGGFFYGCLFAFTYTVICKAFKKKDSQNKQVSEFSAELVIQQFYDRGKEIYKLYDRSELIKGAQAFIKIDRIHPALEIYEHLLQDDDTEAKNDVILYDLGDIYYTRLHQRETAKSMYRLLIDTYPESPLKDSAEFQIKVIEKISPD